MKKNGFTLVELLGVVTILAMLGMIIVPVIDNVLRNNKRKLYDVQIRVIKDAASSFVTDRVFDEYFNIDPGDSLGIRLGKLKEFGYIEGDVVNPIDKTNFPDSLLIIISNENNGYSYTVCDEDTQCDSNVEVFGEA